MSALSGEQCGWCATPQYEGAKICRSCGAKRTLKYIHVERDTSGDGVLLVFLLAIGGLIGWYFESWWAFWISFIFLCVCAYEDQSYTQVIWYR